MPTQYLLQVQMRAEGELVAVACCLVVVVAAMQVASHLTHIIEGEVIALVQQLGPGAAPVAGHPFGFAGKSLGSLCTAAAYKCKQGQRSQCLDAFALFHPFASSFSY
ncbi:hypothetical protein D3C76_1591860 [compost metagenome]